MSHTTVYINRNPNLDGGELGWISAAIMAGTSIFGALLGGGGPKATYQGLAGINAGGSQLIGQLQQILAGITPQNAGQAVQAAMQLANTLNDPATFYPAKKGKDAEALANFKTQAGQLVSQIQARASEVSAQAAQAAGIDPMTGQPVAPSIAGIPLSTLLLIGGGALGLVFLLRK